MKTMSYVLGNEREVLVGEEYYFGQLWDGSGDGTELLESGSICTDDGIVDFDVVSVATDVLESTVVITGVSSL